MTPGPAARGIRAVLLDIEGTTTPIAFVHDVLFGFARDRLRAFLHDHASSPEVDAVRHELAAEHADDVRGGEAPPPWPGAPAGLEAMAAYALWLMDRDRKSPGLKALQGLIWEEGYHAGLLRGEVFDDVPAALRRWHETGVTVAIYSSGSELAQRRLFQSTRHGDLTPFISGFFDTAVGPKVERESYTRIAVALRRRPGEILFVSDVARELEAARAAGLAVVLAVRPGNAPQAGASRYRTIGALDEIALGRDQ